MIQKLVKLMASAILACGILFAQSFDDLKIDRVSAGHKFTEGPVWSPEGFLLFSDVPNDKILKLVPGKGTQPYRDNSNGANGNGIDDKGRLLSCESRTRRLVREHQRANRSPRREVERHANSTPPTTSPFVRTATSGSLTRPSANKPTRSRWITTASITSRPKASSNSCSR